MACKAVPTAMVIGVAKRLFRKIDNVFRKV